MYRRAFTLIEVLVSVAIISLLVALIIPNIDRSLSKNNVANDAQVFKAKLEEARLLSGSMQTDDGIGVQLISRPTSRGYGILLRSGSNYKNYYTLASVTDAGTQCSMFNVSLQAEAQSGKCFIERIKLSSGVNLEISQDIMIFYRAPGQQLAAYTRSGGSWILAEPVFPDPLFRLSYQDKVANVDISDYTGRITVSFEGSDEGK